MIKKNNLYLLILIMATGPLFSMEMKTDVSMKKSGDFVYLTQKMIEAAQEILDSEESVGAVTAEREHVSYFAKLPPLQRLIINRFLEALYFLADGAKYGRPFNLGIASCPDGGYLLSVRTNFNKRFNEENQKIVPGNRSHSKFEKGEGFWWGLWGHADLQGAVLYFYMDANWEKLRVLFPVFFFPSDSINESHSDSLQWWWSSDIRLSRGASALNDNPLDNDIFVYEAHHENIAAQVNFTLLDTQQVGNSYLKNIGTISFENDLKNLRKSNNYGIFKIDFKEKKYEYFDWLIKDGFLVTKCELEDNKIVSHRARFKNADYPVIGTGSRSNDMDAAKKDAAKNAGIMPNFSFGSSVINLGPNEVLFVGHSKIEVDEKIYAYEKGSNVDQFRAALVESFKNNFGERYVRHDGSISTNEGAKEFPAKLSEVINPGAYQQFRQRALSAPSNEEVGLIINDVFSLLVEKRLFPQDFNFLELFKGKQTAMRNFLKYIFEISELEGPDYYYLGFHYLMYFCKVTFDDSGDVKSVFISDSFLPIDVKRAYTEGEYVFSLVFPMGICKSSSDPTKLFISMGVGDFDPAIIKMDRADILDLCKHDALNLNLRNYEYKLMVFDGEGHYQFMDKLPQREELKTK